MNQDQLAELDCHLAAGTDLPTAVAAIADDRPALDQSGRSYSAWWSALAVILCGLVWVLVRK